MSRHTKLEPSTVLAAQNGDDKALEALMKAMEPMVRSAARKAVSGSTTPQEDMEQEAWIGVLNALQTFDADLGTFESWAYGPMRNAMKMSLPTYAAGPVVEPSTAQEYFRALTAADGDPAEAEEIFVSHGRSSRAFQDAHAAFSGTYSSSAFSDSEADRFDIEAGGDAFEDVATRLEAEAWLSELDPELEIVLRYSVGLGDLEDEPKTDEEIADLLGMSRPTVQRRRMKALRILREIAEGVER